MMRQIGIGMALAFQFFSVVPVRKELPLEKDDVTSMYMALPMLGALFGSFSMLFIYLLRDFTDISALLAAFIAVLFMVAATGGLHMDGLADVGDAYFSYQQREKRLEIMGDPRIGAFGTMVLLFAVIGKILLVAEQVFDIPLALIVIVPILARIGLLLLFSAADSAKAEGLASFFKQRTDPKRLVAAAIIYLLITTGLLVYISGWVFAAAIIIVFLLASILYRQWCLRNFGGITGDLCGAYVEGVELVLWTALLLFT